MVQIVPFSFSVACCILDPSCHDNVDFPGAYLSYCGEFPFMARLLPKGETIECNPTIDHTVFCSTYKFSSSYPGKRAQTWPDLPFPYFERGFRPFSIPACRS